MPDISAIFFDVGGVLLSNGWDHRARARAVDHFGLDPADFESRHELVVSDFERGRLSLQDYMRSTVFYVERPFGADEFRDFMLGLSHPHPEAIAIARALGRSPGPRVLATLNNESRELNDYRIRAFGLDRIFDVFLSSCYLGATKPGETIFRLALEMTQRPAAECLFIDDRPLNVECARQLGLRTIHYRGPAPLRRALAALGIELPTESATDADDDADTGP